MVHKELHHNRELLRLAKMKPERIKKYGSLEGRPAIAFRGGVPPARYTPSHHHRMSVKEYLVLFTNPPEKHHCCGPPRSPTPSIRDDALMDDDQEEDPKEHEYETEHSIN